MLCSQHTNTPKVQLPHPNKLYLLFTDVSKFCYSGVFTQASAEDSNEALLRILTSEDPLKIVESQTQNIWFESNIVHPVAYISGSQSQSQCRWPAITKECSSVFMAIKKCSFNLQNAGIQIIKLLLRIFTGHTGNDRCSALGLDAAAIPKCVKVQFIKGVVNVLADSVSRLRAGGLYHGLDFYDHQQEFSTPFEPLPPVEQTTPMPLEVNEIFIAPNIEKHTQNYEALHDLPTARTDKAKLSLENAWPMDIQQLEQNLMSLPELTPDKVTKLIQWYILQKHDTTHRLQ